MSFSNILNRSKQALINKLTPITIDTTIQPQKKLPLSNNNMITNTITTSPTPVVDGGPHYFEMANTFLFGRNGCPIDPITAVYYLKKSISIYNHTPSQGVLGFFYEFGLGVPQDFIQAEKYYLLAASSSTEPDALSMARLAFLRKYGRPGVKIDRVEAEVWAQKVSQVDWIIQAAKTNSCAQYALGVCYHDGVGLTKSEKDAFYWYTKSAEQGNPRGQGN